MQSLTFVNSNNQSLSIGYSRPFLLSDLIGLSGAPVDILANRGYQQDGQTSAGQFYQPRPVAFNVIIMEPGLQRVFQYRRQLVAFLNSKDTFLVVYANDYITKQFTCRVSVPPDFASTQANFGKPQFAPVSLICDDPYLYDLTETSVRMSMEEPAFMFPLVIPEDGMVFGRITNKQVTINNTGDIETPVKIHFIGGITNPTISNDTTGEIIIVNRAIAATDVLEITTGYGKKNVWIIAADGTKTSAFNYINSGATIFFSLAVGENVLSFDAESGADAAACYIYYSQRYLGV